MLETMLYCTEPRVLRARGRRGARAFSSERRRTDVPSSANALRRLRGMGERSADSRHRPACGLSHTEMFKLEQWAMSYRRDRRFAQP